MTAPHYINQNKSDMRDIKSGWYAIENDGTLSSGPFSSREQCNEKNTQLTNGTMATSREVNLLGHLNPLLSRPCARTRYWPQCAGLLC